MSKKSVKGIPGSILNKYANKLGQPLESGKYNLLGVAPMKEPDDSQDLNKLVAQGDGNLNSGNGPELNYIPPAEHSFEQLDDDLFSDGGQDLRQAEEYQPLNPGLEMRIEKIPVVEIKKPRGRPSYGEPFTSSGYARSSGDAPVQKKRSVRAIQAIPDWAQGDIKTYQPDNRMVSSAPATPSETEAIDVVRAATIFSFLPESTSVFAVAVDKQNDDRNAASAIRCMGGMAFGGYCHDLSRDSYLVRCVDFLQVGIIPFAMSMTLPNVGEWRIKIPLPEAIIENNISPDQRIGLDEFRKKYPSPGYEIQFMQMLGCDH